MSALLIGLGGRAGSGKDTLAALLVKHLNFVQMPLALPIKRALNAMFDWSLSQWNDREWKERVQPHIGKSPRQLAQTLGTEWGRNLINQDLWLLATEMQPEFLSARVVISDVRFPNEVDFIKRHNGQMFYITRPGISAVATHESEKHDIYNLADFVVNNSSTPQDMLDQVKDYLYAQSQS